MSSRRELGEVAAEGDAVDDHEQDERADAGDQQKQVEGQGEQVEQ